MKEYLFGVCVVCYPAPIQTTLGHHKAISRSVPRGSFFGTSQAMLLSRFLEDLGTLFWHTGTCFDQNRIKKMSLFFDKECQGSDTHWPKGRRILSHGCDLRRTVRDFIFILSVGGDDLKYSKNVLSIGGEKHINHLRCTDITPEVMPAASSIAGSK